MRLATILLISFFINYKRWLKRIFLATPDFRETRIDDVNLKNNQIDKLFKLTFRRLMQLWVLF